MFKDNHSFESRCQEATRILSKYPERIPIICEKLQSDTSIPKIDKIKYLVPCDLTIGQFIYVIRKRVKVEPEKAIFIFVDGIIPSSSELVSTMYQKHKDKDGFLYVTYSGENTFGNTTSKYYLNHQKNIF